MTISIIVAADNLLAIGKDNKIPWHIPDDLKYFKQMTLNRSILMGRKTYESIYLYLGKPLPDRQSVVFSKDASELIRDKKYQYPEVALKDDLISRLEIYKNSKLDFMVVGGSSIYAQALPYASLVYLTQVNCQVENPDSFFPVLDKAEWQLYYHEPRYNEEKVLSHTFMIYKRVPTV